MDEPYESILRKAQEHSDKLNKFVDDLIDKHFSEVWKAHVDWAFKMKTETCSMELAKVFFAAGVGRALGADAKLADTEKGDLWKRNFDKLSADMHELILITIAKYKCETCGLYHFPEPVRKCTRE